MYKKILLPTDGSEHAHKATKHAIWTASMSNAELIALNVIDTSLFMGLPAEDTIERVKEMLKEQGKRLFEEIFDMAVESKARLKIEVKLTFMTKEGFPADMILKTIDEEDVDLVVMGTSGKRGMDRFLLGSVTENVVRSGTCPVLVVQ